MTQISDNLYLGPAQTYMGAGDAPSPSELGVGPMGRCYVWDVVPLALNLTGLAAAQAVAGAGNLTLTAGTGVTTSVGADGVTRYVLDCARCVDILSSNAGDTTQTATVYGYDIYNQPMTEVITFNGTTRAAGQKAFKSVYRVAISAALAGNGSVGFTDIIGCPVRLLSKDYVSGIVYNATVVALAAVTAADTTSPATTTTNDVRGTVTLPSAADGSKRLVAMIAVPAIACGPTATRVGALGVTQA